jgi:ribosomal protection tetracycline resistance protein
MAALDQAGTVVCEPMIRVSLEIPADTVRPVLAAVARLGGVAGTPALRADLDDVTVLPGSRCTAATCSRGRSRSCAPLCWTTSAR